MNTAIEQLIKEFELFDDWEDKYLFIIELGNTLPKFHYAEKIDSNRVLGCASQVWLTFRRKDNKFYFFADSDSLIVKGLLAIIIKIYSNKTQDEIKNINFVKVFNSLNLKKHLTPSRNNGLLSVRERINKIAKIF